LSQKHSPRSTPLAAVEEESHIPDEAVDSKDNANDTGNVKLEVHGIVEDKEVADDSLDNLEVTNYQQQDAGNIDIIDIQAIAKNKLMRINTSYDGFVFHVDPNYRGETVKTDDNESFLGFSVSRKNSRIHASADNENLQGGDQGSLLCFARCNCCLYPPGGMQCRYRRRSHLDSRMVGLDRQPTKIVSAD
jgi:hypothetical protein